MNATPDTVDDPKQNRILATLDDADYSRLLHDLERVPLKVGQVLFKAGEKLEYVYFLTSGIVARVFTTKDGSSAGLAMTGKDGFVGIPLVLGGIHSSYEAVVQSKGFAYRLPAASFTWELEQSENLLQLSLAYVQALMTQIAQSVVCNRHHHADQQLCRWLLLSLDLLGGNQIDMTQEVIADMLGVRRECVTAAAGKLQDAGLIHYSRGRIIIVDRAGIQQRACECYNVVKSEYDRLFGLKPVSPSKGKPRHNPATLRQRAEKRLEQMPSPPEH
ncbi:Crp/Fnr family transcriptional regulator [Nitrincola sp. A-D6]|uniref:Crp/Fnr family transcriptional regulator n=1 Tax=Nitrincola sp. A-D6 TaxID=1545442 RepID=UPI0009DFC4B7|nr:Crp/Fnr family transcriptional regulator [Nitrincola sp. A-D6]